MEVDVVRVAVIPIIMAMAMAINLSRLHHRFGELVLTFVRGFLFQNQSVLKIFLTLAE
jgi:hypothetical protein